MVKVKLRDTIKTAILFVLFFTLVCGILYPFLVAEIAKIGWKEKAEGKEQYIGQEFKEDKYFWGRPSKEEQTDEAMERRKQKLQKPEQEIPKELLQVSGSGLDPNISEKAAYYQIERIAQTREIEKSKIEELIQEQIRKNSKLYPWIGEKVINVLEINEKLDQL